MKTFLAIALLGGVVGVVLAQSTEYNGPVPRARGNAVTDQIIVRWRAGASGASISAKVAEAASGAGVQLHRKQPIGAGIEVLKLERPLAAHDFNALIARLQANPEVEFAVADQRRYAHAVPTDPLISEQWYFLAAEPAATRAEQAWDATTGSAATIVAVLDSGVRFDHPDLGRVELGGKLLPGFDFVSNVAIANDGDGRDGDASDPGDWVSAEDAQQPPFNSGDCIPGGGTHVDSSWHGTRVASLIAAATNNAQGMAGAGWNTLVSPVRVLGKCGGTDSDIIAAMRWAAGIAVPGAPVNPNPAKIINLSLGAEGPCSAAYQSAIPEITAHGVLIVASVGNEGGPVGSPANCAGVLGVTGLRHAGTKVGFSNLGPEASLGAPGGNCINTGVGQPCLYSIVAATNTGVTSPDAAAYTNQFNFNVGTSFSAPLATGAAALMHAVNAQLTPASFVTILRESAAPFAVGSATTASVCRVPSGPGDLQAQECICTTQTCGAGMLNMQAAVLAAQRPFAVAGAATVIASGVEVPLEGRNSFAANGRVITAYQWSLLNVTGAAPTIAGISQASATLQVGGASQFTLRLTVTDDLGAQDSADVAMATTAPSPAPAPTPTPDPAPTATPMPARSGGGGGAASSLLISALSVLAMVCALLRRRSQLGCKLP
jgi:serine protease